MNSTATLSAPLASENQIPIAPSNGMQRKGKPRCPLKSAAMVAGHKVYLGTPCKYGHDGMRSTRTGACLTCSDQYSQSEAARAAHRRHYLKQRAIEPPKARAVRERTPLQVAHDAAIQRGDQFFTFPCKHHGPNAQRFSFANAACRFCASDRATKKLRTT
jgi:hypothetical protein